MFIDPEAPLQQTKKPIKFGIHDYWRMFLKRDFRLPISYFFNAHLFDLLHNTDTHTWLPKELYTEKPQNFNSGVLYMTSWTNEIRRSFKALHKLNLLSQEYIFIDIGCGKGKVILTWGLLEKKYLKKMRRKIGIEFYNPLLTVAKENYFKTFGIQGEFYLEDATKFNFTKFSQRLIVYLYNPFDESIMRLVLMNLPIGTIVIYNYPINFYLFVNSEYQILYKHNGFHCNSQTNIYIKVKPTH